MKHNAISRAVSRSPAAPTKKMFSALFGSLTLQLSDLQCSPHILTSLVRFGTFLQARLPDIGPANTTQSSQQEPGFMMMKNRNPVRMIVSLALYFSITCGLAASQQKPLGEFAGQTDVGNPSKLGSAIYDPEKQEYTIEGAGTNMWMGRDEFHFVW